MCVESLSHALFFVTPRTVARQAPLSMGILQARILEWVAMPPPGDFPKPGIKSRSPTLQADSLPSEPTGKPRHTIFKDTLMTTIFGGEDCEILEMSFECC